MLTEELKEKTLSEHQASEKKMIILEDIRQSGLPNSQYEICRELPAIDSAGPGTTKQQGAILEAAKATFITFKNRIVKHELQPQL